MLPHLSYVLEYKNQHVLNRYTKDYPNNKLINSEALDELIKYFWLCRKHKIDLLNDPNRDELQFVCSVHKEMSDIDDMWHTFLLFTKDYMDFCHNYFGEYLHHFPANDDKRPKKEVFEMEFTRYLSYIYDNLGEITVKKWFSPLLADE